MIASALSKGFISYNTPWNNCISNVQSISNEHMEELGIDGFSNGHLGDGQFGKDVELTNKVTKLNSVIK